MMNCSLKTFQYQKPSPLTSPRNLIMVQWYFTKLTSVLSSAVPPSIADEATELVVSRLSSVVIGCTASGFPTPVIHWSKDGIHLAKEGEGYKILPSGDFFFIQKHRN